MNRNLSFDGLSLRTELAKPGVTATVVLALYTLGIAAAEIALATGWLVPALLLHVLVLVSALVQFGLQPQAVYGRILPMFALVSLLRVLSVMLPHSKFNPFGLDLLVAVPLLVGIWLTVRLLNLSVGALGFTRADWKPQAMIAASGLVLGCLAFAVIRPTPLVPQNTLGITLSILGLVVVGFWEEVLFRGMLAQALDELWGTVGLVAAAVVFGVMYAATLSPGMVLVMFGSGIFWSLVFKRTRTIWGIGAAHALLNVVAFVVLPLLKI